MSKEYAITRATKQLEEAKGLLQGETDHELRMYAAEMIVAYKQFLKEHEWIQLTQ